MKRYYRKNAKKSLRRGKAPRSSKKSTVSAKLRTKKFNKLRKTASKVKVSVPPETVRETYFSTRGKPKRRGIKGASNVFTKTPTGFQIKANSGQQQYGYINMASRTQLTEALTGTGSEPDNLAGTLVDTNLIHWRSCRTTVMITNSTNAITNLTIYHYVYKRDTSIAVDELWKRGMYDAQGDTTNNTTAYGVRPQLSPMVNQYLKLKKTYDYTIAAGSTIKHNWFEGMNKTISNEVISSEASPNNYYAGMTQVILMVAKGFPGTSGTPNNPATPGEIGGNTVNTTPCKLDIAYFQEYRYTYMADNQPNVSVFAGSGMGAIDASVLVYDQNGNSTTDAEAATKI